MAAASHIRVVLAVALMALAAVVARPAAPPEAPALVATASGDLRLASSAADEAILDADGLRPGDSTSGSLTLSNKSTAEQSLKLKTVGITDIPGPGGGELSEHLNLLVQRTSGTTTHEVFSGKVAALSEVDLGPLPASQAQLYTFTATVPEGGPALDDPYAGSTVQVGWRWEATVEKDAEPPLVAEPEASAPADDTPPTTPAAPEPGTTATPRAGDTAPSADRYRGDDEGPAPAAGGAVRLWAAATPVQRLRALRGGRTSLAVLVRCRPLCSVTAAAKVKLGRRWVTLRGRALGAVGRQSDAVRLSFRLTPAESRRLRRALRSKRVVPVRIGVRATAAGHARAERTLAVKLRR